MKKSGVRLNNGGRQTARPADKEKRQMSRKRPTAGGPAWLSNMYDIIDGKYDNDPETIKTLLAPAQKDVREKGFVYTCSSPAMALRSARAVRQATERSLELLNARVEALKARCEEVQAGVKHQREERESLEKALKKACERGASLQKQLTERIDKLLEDKSGKTLYQRLEDGEFNSLHYTLFFDILKRGCEEAARLDTKRYAFLFSPIGRS